ncbi:BTB/POZ domain protein [Metarhizium robertsii]|uniref:BTB/POZ domain protein n=1 Tax=Metarhizium robertsii TaxID=568076 RepID=A0A0A1UR57_9HYPO|nr:BTB/POZ domain protein [Metarhizium robertsii]
MDQHDAHCELRRQISAPLKSGEFSDLTFLCEGQRIPAHRIIVCPQSPVIQAACTGSYKQETGVYEIKDVSFDVVRQMVEYLYTGRYQVPSSQDSDDKKQNAVLPLVFHARMVDVADTYIIKGLKSLSMANFKKSARRDPDDCAFLRSIVDIYSLQCESSQVLRDIVVESVRERLARCLDFSKDGLLYEITKQVPSFCHDLIGSLFSKPMLGYCTRCGPEKLVEVVPLHCGCKNCEGFASTLAEQRSL